VLSPIDTSVHPAYTRARDVLKDASAGIMPSTSGSTTEHSTQHQEAAMPVKVFVSSTYVDLKDGSEANGIKLSPKQSRNLEVVELLVSEFTIASPFGLS
jgi:hypothetical protein